MSSLETQTPLHPAFFYFLPYVDFVNGVSIYSTIIISILCRMRSSMLELGGASWVVRVRIRDSVSYLKQEVCTCFRDSMSAYSHYIDREQHANNTVHPLIAV